MIKINTEKRLIGSSITEISNLTHWEWDTLILVSCHSHKILQHESHSFWSFGWMLEYVHYLEYQALSFAFSFVLIDHSRNLVHHTVSNVCSRATCNSVHGLWKPLPLFWSSGFHRKNQQEVRIKTGVRDFSWGGASTEEDTDSILAVVVLLHVCTVIHNRFAYGHLLYYNSYSYEY